MLIKFVLRALSLRLLNIDYPTNGKLRFSRNNFAGQLEIKCLMLADMLAESQLSQLIYFAQFLFDTVSLCFIEVKLGFLPTRPLKVGISSNNRDLLTNFSRVTEQPLKISNLFDVFCVVIFQMSNYNGFVFEVSVTELAF